MSKIDFSRCLSKCWPIGAGIFLVWFALYHFQPFITCGNRSIVQSSNEPENELDGCFHVYLDVGSNIGIQVRKLFEPVNYSEARETLAIFNSYFGVSKSGMAQNTICSIGFEPNARHAARLLELERSYRKCGWRVKFFTETAVSNRNGTAYFKSDGDVANNEWGGKITSDVSAKYNGTNGSDTAVRLMRLSDFIRYNVLTRKIPPGLKASDKPNIVMKIDIEGAELEVFPDLLLTGVAAEIDLITMEWHPHLTQDDGKQQELLSLEGTAAFLTQLSSKYNFSSKVNIQMIDDELYHISSFPLPEC